MKNIYAALALLAIATTAFAGVTAVPEIDGSTAVSAITLIGGAALVLRSRRKR